MSKERFSGAYMAKKAAEGFSEGTLGRETEYEAKDLSKEYGPFDKLPEDEQIELIYQVQSLVAQKRDLIKSEKTSENKHSSYEVVYVPGGRRIVTKRKLAESAAALDPNRAERIKAQMQEKRDFIDKKLASLNTIPGLKKAYSKEISRIYLCAKLIQEVDELEDEIAQREYTIQEIREQAEESGAGTPIGRDREEINFQIKKLQEAENKIESINNEESVGPFLGLLKSSASTASLSSPRAYSFLRRLQCSGSAASLHSPRTYSFLRRLQSSTSAASLHSPRRYSFLRGLKCFTSKASLHSPRAQSFLRRLKSSGSIASQPQTNNPSARSIQL
ncbi:MAG: hypothetical protein Q8Q18_03665 [bacterium]|nr:hypothetical protein [bacterium]